MSHAIGLPGGSARAVAAVTVLLLSLATADASARPAAAAQPLPEGEFVGHVDADSFIGVVIGNGQVIAFVCDGTGNGLNTTQWAWFSGPIGGAQTAVGRGEGASRAPRSGAQAGVGVRTEIEDGEGNTLRLVFVDGVLRGDVRLVSGLDTGFSLVPADGEAGLYRAEDTLGEIELVGGWIVLHSLEYRGAALVTGIMAEPMTRRFIEQDNFNPMTGTVNLLGTSITAARVTLR